MVQLLLLPDQCRTPLPALGGYLYAQRDDRLYVNLFVSSQTTAMLNGVNVAIAQQTDYPWSGTVRIQIDPEQPVHFALGVRIPGWAQGTPVPSDLYHYLDTQKAG
ncbi:MAG: glycoside hydrolase family 127 protein [Anaerolineales bacterium]|nr:glycoside hydrolase family 127 protein [Anaerolineales bacterium]